MERWRRGGMGQVNICEQWGQDVYLSLKKSEVVTFLERRLFQEIGDLELFGGEAKAEFN
jgi:hypothetical protein